MTDGLDQALAQFALDLLDADPNLTVFDGAVPSNPTPAPPYVVVYTTIDRPRDDPDNPPTGQSRVWRARWICHCVGGNASAARAVAQRARTQLLNVRPVITGLSCDLIDMEPDGQPPQRDETTGALVMDQVKTFRLKATS